jgi:DNA-binding CsgD family transcriptional regulator
MTFLVQPRSARTSIAAETELKRIVRAARVYLGMQVGFISEFTGGKRVFRYVDMSDGDVTIEVGDSDNLDESYCYRIATGELENIITNTAENPITASLAVTKNLGIGSYIGTPIRLNNGEIFGTFCCFSSSPDPSIVKRDHAILETFAALAAGVLQGIVDKDHSQSELERIFLSLTPKEKSVLDAFSDGASNKVVAQRLELSLRSVKMYRMKIYAKLGVINLPQALQLVWSVRDLEAVNGNEAPKSDSTGSSEPMEDWSWSG